MHAWNEYANDEGREGFRESRQDAAVFFNGGTIMARDSGPVDQGVRYNMQCTVV